MRNFFSSQAEFSASQAKFSLARSGSICSCIVPEETGESRSSIFSTERGWSRPEMAPQQLEKIESAPGNGMGSGASDPQDLVHGRADRALLRLTSRENDKVAEKGA
jgi:hypothetical protein